MKEKKSKRGWKLPLPDVRGQEGHSGQLQLCLIQKRGMP